MVTTAETALYESAPLLSQLNEADEGTATWTDVSRCGACTSGRIAPFANIRHVRYSRCRDCGFTFADPRPSKESLAKFYNSPFFNNYRRCERERIKSEPYFSMSTHCIPMIADWLKDYARANLLDFGCGPGSFLAYLRDKQGFVDLDGIELNAESAMVAHDAYGLDIATDISQLRKAPYQVVTLIEVIEHMPDAEEIMTLIRSLLKIGGKLLLTTDAVNNIPSRFFPSWAPYFTGPSHISLFTEQALAKLLTRFGFRIEKRHTHPCNQIIGDFWFSPFYKLDFASPSSSTDIQDLLYVPNFAGRLMRLRATRSPSIALKLVRKLDGLAGRALRIATGSSFSSHQFILATRLD